MKTYNNKTMFHIFHKGTGKIGNLPCLVEVKQYVYATYVNKWTAKHPNAQVWVKVSGKDGSLPWWYEIMPNGFTRYHSDMIVCADFAVLDGLPK